MPISNNLSNEICFSIKRHIPNVLAIYAFGSQVSGFVNLESDLDLAVLVEGYAAPVLLWNLANGELADIAKMSCFHACLILGILNSNGEVVSAIIDAPYFIEHKTKTLMLGVKP